MTIKERYEAARESYKAVGVDTDQVLLALKQIPISMHCWQGDDVTGFDGAGALSGGIQTPEIIRDGHAQSQRMMAEYGQGAEPDSWKTQNQPSCKLRSL